MKTRTAIASLIVLIIAVSVLAVGYISQRNTNANYSYALENYYQRTFYELVDNINDIELNMSKGLVATGKTTKVEAFEYIEKDCSTAIGNLSRLPINHESINETTRLVNQLGGYAYYVSQKLKSDFALSETDINQLDTLYDYTIKVQQSLNDFQKSINDDFSFVVEMLDNKTNRVSTTMSSLQSKATGVEYPTLIYDGPFSDSVTNKEIKGLSGEMITKNDAQKIIWDKIGGVYTIESIEYISNTQSRFSTFDFKIIRKNLPDMYVQVTEKGGMILTISSNISSDGDKKLTLEDSKTKAEEFAITLGFNDLKAVWGTIINNTAYINLTTYISDTIIYPEMIKVKVDITSGSIVGFEATNYAYNHQLRTNLTPTVSATTAREKLDSKLKVETQKLCIIPREYKEDLLCYEFKCTLNNYTYYIYVNAINGAEENILRVVQTNDGELIE